MGNSCVSNHRVRRKRSTMGDDYPEGIEGVDDAQGPELDLELVISDIALKQPPNGIFGLRVTIDGVLEWNYQKVKISETGSQRVEIKEWKKERHAVIRANEHSLKRMFLNFRLLNNDGTEAGVLALNMFCIMTGPWRHDFPIRQAQGQTTRLILDIKCTQTIQLTMAATKVQLNFLNEHPGEMFHFTLKSEDLLGNCQQSGESYDVETFLYNKKRKYQVDGQGESATYRNRKTMILENHKGLMWTSSISQKGYMKDLPSFSISVKVDSISSYGFQFVLWRKSQEDADTFESYGESNIPLSKLFWTDVKGGNLNPEIGGVREVDIEEPIEFMGKKCGVMAIRCKVTTPKFFQQVLVFTRTQLGVSQIRSQITSNNSECDSLKKIRAIKQSMLTTVWKSGNIKNELTEKGMGEFKEYRNAIYQDILRLERIFVQGNQNNPFFEYSSQEDMLKSQVEMIEILDKFIPLTQLREVCLSEATWRCMKILLFRGEFLLSKMGFSSQEIHEMNTVSRSKLPKKLQGKISMAESYQELLLRLLQIALGKLGRKLLSEQFKFIFSLCSVCYLKIPEFRKELLEIIENPQDQPRIYCFQKWHNKDSFEKLVDWESLFSKPLELYGTNKSLIEQFRGMGNWKQILAKRNTYYFALLEDLASNIGRVIGSGDAIKFWGIIPGYQCLVGSFLHEMKTRRVTEYPDALKDANISFLQNQCLLPIFIKTLLQKTNTYDITCALKSIQLLGAYFFNIQHKKKTLPSCFDGKLFYHALKNVIISQNCFTIAKILELIYVHFNIFNQNLKTEISMLLLGSSFFNLMLHWGKVVRNIFQYLIVYRIVVWAKEKEALEVMNRWKELKEILDEAEMNVVKQSKEEVCINYRKNYFEKMKSKLNFKKRRFSEDLVLKKRARSETFGMYSDKTEDTLGFARDNNSCMIFNEQPSLKTTPTRRVKFSEEINEIDLKSMNDFGGMRSISDITDKKSSRTRRKSCYSDFQINSMSEKEGKYVEWSNKELEKIEEEFRVWVRVKSDMNDIPRIDIKVPIDEGDMRPDTIET